MGAETTREGWLFYARVWYWSPDRPLMAAQPSAPALGMPAMMATQHSSDKATADGDMPVSLMALQGRRITLDELLSSLDVVHHPAPGRHHGAHTDADTDVEGGRGGTSRVSRTSAITREGSRASGRSSIKTRVNMGIRQAAQRAAAVFETPGTISEETGAAARAAAAVEAVARAGERATRYERGRRASASPVSARSTTPPSEGRSGPLSAAAMSTPRSEATPRSLRSPRPGSTPRSLRSSTPRSINLISTPRLSSPRAHERTRPRNPLGPRSWLSPDQRALLHEQRRPATR